MNNTPKPTWQQQIINDIMTEIDDEILYMLRYNPQVINVYLESNSYNLPNENIYYKFIDLYQDCKSFNFCPICTNQLSHEYDYGYGYCQTHKFYLPDTIPFFSFENFHINGKIALDYQNLNAIPLNTIISNHNHLSLINIIHALNKYNIFK